MRTAEAATPAIGAVVEHATSTTRKRKIEREREDEAREREDEARERRFEVRERKVSDTINKYIYIYTHTHTHTHPI